MRFDEGEGGSPPSLLYLPQPSLRMPKKWRHFRSLMYMGAGHVTNFSFTMCIFYKSDFSLPFVKLCLLYAKI